MTTQVVFGVAVTISQSRKNANLKDVQSLCWLRNQKSLDVGFWFPLRYEEKMRRHSVNAALFSRIFAVEGFASTSHH
jgi:hypothetical protein